MRDRRLVRRCAETLWGRRRWGALVRWREVAGVGAEEERIVRAACVKMIVWAEGVAMERWREGARALKRDRRLVRRCAETLWGRRRWGALVRWLNTSRDMLLQECRTAEVVLALAILVVLVEEQVKSFVYSMPLLEVPIESDPFLG